MNRTQGPVYMDLEIHFCEDFSFFLVCALSTVAHGGQQRETDSLTLWAFGSHQCPKWGTELAASSANSSHPPKTRHTLCLGWFAYLVVALNKHIPKPTLSDLKGLDSEPRGFV